MINQKFLAIGIVALLLVGGLWFLGAGDGSSWGGGDENDDLAGEVTVYIEDLSSGEVLRGQVALGEASLREQMMLSFGGGIREEDFRSLFTQDVSGIYRNSKYAVWAEATIVLSGEHIESVGESEVQFSGRSGLGGYHLCYAKSYTSHQDYETVHWTGTFGMGSNVVNMNDDCGKQFKHIYFNELAQAIDDPDNPDLEPYIDLIGSDINGMRINCYVDVSAVDDNGDPVTAEAHAELTLRVTSWGGDGSLSIEITDMSSGGW